MLPLNKKRWYEVLFDLRSMEEATVKTLLELDDACEDTKSTHRTANGFNMQYWRVLAKITYRNIEYMTVYLDYIDLLQCLKGHSSYHGPGNYDHHNTSWGHTGALTLSILQRHCRPIDISTLTGTPWQARMVKSFA
jgi:hypothetical protein